MEHDALFPPSVRGCAHPPACHTGQVPVFASATVKARKWLLVEHEGPWAEKVLDGDLPADVRVLGERATARGIRLQMIRRPGRRSRRRREGRRVFVADSTGPAPWLAEGVLTDPDDLDLDSLVDGVVPPSCILVTEPVFLVCTHAKRNVCCGRIGLPLARHLGRNLPGNVWETSHVGGDRFAANLVCLPHGLYYGSMSEAAALAAANAYRRGEVVLDRFRGRAGIPEPLQAAEYFVREHTGELSVAAVAVESSRSDGDVTTAIVRCGDVRFRVVVEPTVFPAPCGTAFAETITTYRPVSLDRCTPVRRSAPVLT